MLYIWHNPIIFVIKCIYIYNAYFSYYYFINYMYFISLAIFTWLHNYSTIMYNVTVLFYYCLILFSHNLFVTLKAKNVFEVTCQKHGERERERKRQKVHFHFRSYVSIYIRRTQTVVHWPLVDGERVKEGTRAGWR